MRGETFCDKCDWYAEKKKQQRNHLHCTFGCEKHIQLQAKKAHEYNNITADDHRREK